VVASALELAEIELPQALVDEHVARTRDGVCRLAGAHPGARAHGVPLEPRKACREPLRLLPARVGEADVEPAVAEAARVVLRLAVANEDQAAHVTATATTSAASSASSAAAPSTSPVTPPSQRLAAT